ncbi:hypothetical protein CcCBS67573_g02155 [Chytriomyces confervae]|uniref:Uncharacterized protein n=1 Tax=Chytriomyces confervae TaxID=246404 RepID=A0A507FLS0_9FUNG|nr:hypothetical protein CcCBS67573_g02155 [Chytriomyces confervae]
MFSRTKTSQVPMHVFRVPVAVPSQAPPGEPFKHAHVSQKVWV